RLALAGRGLDLDAVSLGVDVVGTRVDRGQRDLVGIRPAFGHGDQPARLELPGHRAGAGELAAGLREHRPDVGRGPVAVIGRRLDEDGHAAGTVALVHDLLDLLALARTRRPLDRALDVVLGHVDRAGLLHRQAQPEVAVRVPAAGPPCRPSHAA